MDTFVYEQTDQEQDDSSQIISTTSDWFAA